MSSLSHVTKLVSLLIVLVLFAFPTTLAVSSTGFTSNSRLSSYESTNWSGYAVTGSTGSVTNVQGTWLEPSVTCSGRSTSYAAFWVGIDGFSSSTVEQTGTLAECARGHASYTAWYEFYPAGMVTISSITVSPTNTISASVSYSGGKFTVTLTDVTTGKTYSASTTVSGAAESSAEWIAEAPSSCSIFGCSVLPLANFGTAQFSGGSATVSGTSGAIGSFGSNVQEITMVTNSGAVKALPSSLSSDGTSFSVTWKHS